MGKSDQRSVLRVITRLNVGGPARHALLLAKGLAPEYATTLAAGTPPPNEGELGDPEVPVTRLPLVRPIRPVADVRALRAARRLIAATRPQILHTHMAKAGAVSRAAALSIRPRPRVVHTYHGHVLEGYFDRAARTAFLSTERMLARITDVIVAVSTQTRDELLDLGVGTEQQYRVIRLGLDLAPHWMVEGPSGALRRRLGLDPLVPLIGTVGRLVPIKDHHTLLDAMVGLPDVHLAVLGDGELRAELEAQTTRLGLGGRVHFTGWWTDVPGAMSDLDVVVLTSRNEGTPVSLIEAGACARPVVATRVGGVPSVVVDGASGILIPPGDPAALTDALRKLLSDSTLRVTLGHAGRVRSREFASQRLLADMRGLYDELLTP
jgi:glycosyltransferase involved in cell wall biosynthesis